MATWITPARADEIADACIQSHYAGQLAEREGRLREAREAFAKCGVANCPGLIRQDCNALADEVNRKIPTVIVAARSPAGESLDFQLSINGTARPDIPVGRAFELDLGQHVLRFEHSGYDPIELTVVVHAGEKERMIVAELVPQAGPEPRPPPLPLPLPPPVARTQTIEEPGPVLWPTYLTAGITLAGVGVFAAFGAKAVSERSGLLEESGCAPFCTDDDLSGIRRDFLIADVGLGVALAAATATVLLWVLRPTHKRVVPVDGAWVLPGGSGASLRLGGAGVGGTF